jgi:two-component system, cell cycle sensor histidine kinase and response regulator CckA
VSLPAVLEPAGPVPGNGVAREAGGVPLHILLVDDSDDDALLVRRMLYKALPGGLELQHAPSAQQALALLARRSFDLLILDHNLGVTTGLDLLRELQQRGVRAGVIFLTGQGDEAVAVEAMKNGACDYLSKSKLTQEQLAQTIRYALALRRQQAVVREAQEEVQRREERFRALVENAFDATVLLDENATILWASNSNWRVLGYMADDRLGENALDQAHPEDLETVRAILAEALRRPGEPMQICCRVRHADGDWRSIEGVATNRLHESTVQAIVFNFRDVTDRALAQEALRRSERQYQQLFESSSDAILLFEPEGGAILEANVTACETYGFSKAELLGRPVEEITGTPRGEIASALRGQKSHSFEMTHVLPDGTSRAMLVSTTLLEYQGKAAVLSSYRDITQRKRAEQEVQRLNRALLALSRCTQAVAVASDEATLLQTVCRLLEEVGGYGLAWVGYAEHDAAKSIQPVADSESGSDYLASVRVSWGGDGEYSQGPTGKAIRTGQVQMVPNVLEDPAFRPWVTQARKHGFRSVVSLPLKQEERAFGALNIYAIEENFFDTRELELLGELATNLAFGIVAVRTRAERQRALEGLRRALQWQQEIFEGSLDAVFITGSDGHIVDANRAACELTGLAEEQLLRMSLGELQAEPADEGGAYAMALSGAGVCEAALHGRDGREVQVELSRRGILIGGAAYVHTVARDITETKAAQDKLRKLSSAVEQSADMVIITDCTGKIEYVNPAFEAGTGYSRDEALGQTTPLLKSGLHGPEVYQKLWTTVLSGDVYRGTLQNRKKNGELYYAEKTITPVRNARGEIKHFISNDRDMTSQKRAEEALRASELRYRTLFERNLAGVFRASLAGEILECNQATARIFGFDSREELQRPGSMDVVIGAGQRESIVARLLTAGHLVNLELAGKRKDGSPVLLLNNLSLLQDEAGRPSAFEGTVLDITEPRKLQEQLLQAQKMDAVGQLAGGVAHDFNNLLMVISSYAELMLDRLEDDGLRRNAEQIQKAARRAADLTRQLMAFSRKQVQVLRLLDLNTVLAELARMLPRLIGEDIQLAFHAGQGLWAVKADPVQIEQVVMNLATNARDAMPHGGTFSIETANVQLDEQYAGKHMEVPPGRYVMLAATDSGVGIAPEVLPHIFEPFFTTKPTGKGTGLGLATVYGIVKQSGGYVSVYSELGRGTAFKIYLPQANAADQKPEAGERREECLDGSETILLVEDEEAVRESAREYLAGCGYNVLTACNGQEGLEVAESYRDRIWLLVTDVVMPQLGGSELAQRIAAARPDIRVLYISVYTENTVLQHGVRELGTMFLQKPFTLKVLARKIRELLDEPASALEGAAPSSEASRGTG